MPAQLRILVVRFSAIGDVVLTTPLLRCLRKRHPRARITYVTKESMAPIVALNRNINHLITLRPGESLGSLAARINDAGPYDFALDLHGSLRSRGLSRLVRARWNGYPKFRTRRALLIAFGLDRFADVPPVSLRYFRAAEHLNVTPDGGPPEFVTSEFDRNRASSLCPPHYVVLAPGASRAGKQWPEERWRRLAARLDRSGYRVVVLGTAAQQPADPWPHAIEVYGETLGTAAEVLRGAAVAVTNDSGLMHVGSAVNCKLVSIFGPTRPTMGFRPYGRDNTIIEAGLWCRPCSTKGPHRCPIGTLECLRSIDTDRVFNAVRRAA